MPKPSLHLLVLYTERIEELLSFYKALSFRFQKEQHGNGPIHYVCQMSDCMVMEIYPSKKESVEMDHHSIFLGFSVNSLLDLLPKLQSMNGTIISYPKDTSWGKRMVILDPDGRKIELLENI